MKTMTFTTKAPFLMKSGKWSWHTWTNNEPNKHAAMLTKQTEIGAIGCDFGQADHYEVDRFPKFTR